MALNIGIDFGTSTLVVAKWNEEKNIAELTPHIVPSGYGNNEQIDNVVFYESDFEIILGKTALRKLSLTPENGVREIKRHLLNDEWSKVIYDEEKTTVDIMQDVFTYLEKKIRQIYGNEKIDNVVISVPYAFEQKERKKMEQAAMQSNLPVIGLIEEPVAAALSSGLFELLERNVKENILIFDLGGGTFDVTIFEAFIDDESKKHISVLNTDGDKYLGGANVDEIIKQKIIDHIQDREKYEKLSDEEKQKIDFQLFEESRRIKHELSESEDSAVFLYLDTYDLVSDFMYERTQLEKDLEQVFHEKIRKVLKRVVSNSNLSPTQINQIILVGGSSRIPSVSNIIQDMFQRAPKMIDNPSILVAKGAAIYCGILVDEVHDIIVERRTNQGFGIKQKEAIRLLLPKNETYLAESPYYDIVIPSNKIGGKIPIFKSENSELHTAEKIGFIQVLAQSYERNQVRLQLYISKDGTLCYRTYNISGELITTGDVVQI